MVTAKQYNLGFYPSDVELLDRISSAAGVSRSTVIRFLIRWASVHLNEIALAYPMLGSRRWIEDEASSTQRVSLYPEDRERLEMARIHIETEIRHAEKIFSDWSVAGTHVVRTALNYLAYTDRLDYAIRFADEGDLVAMSAPQVFEFEDDTRQEVYFYPREEARLIAISRQLQAGKSTKL